MLQAMIVRLCMTQLQRLGATGAGLISSLRERGHMPAPQACLDRCRACETQLVAVADGAPLAFPDAGALLAEIDQLAAADE